MRCYSCNFYNTEATTSVTSIVLKHEIHGQIGVIPASLDKPTKLVMSGASLDSWQL